MKIIFALWISLVGFAGSSVYKFEQKDVELSGTLDLQSFSGSVGPERHFFLKLDQPIDVRDKNPDGKNSFTEQTNVKILQLVPSANDDKIRNRLRELGKGATVKVKGKLEPQLGPHHFSKVTFFIEELE